MFRKASITILLLLLILGLGACENRLPTTKNNVTKASATIPTVKKVVNKNNPTNRKETDTSNDISYKIIEKNDSKNLQKLKYNIKYPQISGLRDTDKQKKINHTLKDEALKVLNYYKNPYGSVKLNIDYKIVFKSMNLLSIQYSGIGYVSKAAHNNNLFYTTNINIKTGKRIRLKDIVNIDENFANKFLNGDFKAVWSFQSDAPSKYYTKKDIQIDFKAADSLDNIGTKKQSDVYSYFTKNSLGVSIPVGHSIGDHAEFEIKYQDIKNNIKTGNEIWRYLLH